MKAPWCCDPAGAGDGATGVDARAGAGAETGRLAVPLTGAGGVAGAGGAGGVASADPTAGGAEGAAFCVPLRFDPKSRSRNPT